MEKIIENASKAKFYRTNRDIFIKYFDNSQQYRALIASGNFKKMEEIIKLNSKFEVEEFINILDCGILKWVIKNNAK